MISLPNTILLATRNAHKVDELKLLLKPLGIDVKSALDFPNLTDVVEDGSTFQENAIKKAVETAKQSGMPALADDSGLVVEALGGEPGVYSARYAGEGATDLLNNQKLLEKMSGISEDRRNAYFISVLALAYPSGQVHTFEGRCYGRILESPRGTFGFGYDPLFYLPEYGKSMAELTPEEKNRISHRARAYERFIEWLKGKNSIHDA